MSLAISSQHLRPWDRHSCSSGHPGLGYDQAHHSASRVPWPDCVYCGCKPDGASVTEPHQDLDFMRNIAAALPAGSKHAKAGQVMSMQLCHVIVPGVSHYWKLLLQEWTCHGLPSPLQRGHGFARSLALTSFSSSVASLWILGLPATSPLAALSLLWEWTCSCRPASALPPR